MENKADLQHILIIEHGEIKNHFVLEKEICSIGRHSSNSINIDNSKISRYHCTILPVKYKNDHNQQVYWIIDGDLKGNRSSNGLFVNGNKCLSHELKFGDKIGIGGEDIVAHYELVDASKLSISDITESESESESESELIYETIIDNYSQETLTNLIDLTSSLIYNAEEIFPIIEEILLTLQDHNSDKYYPIFEINLAEKITYSNSLFREKFSTLRQNFKENSLMKNLIYELESSYGNICFREIEYEEQQFAQFSHYTENKNKIRSYLFNINQRNQLKTALLNSEEKYRVVVKQISEGIILIDPISKKIIEANNAYCRLIGYNEQEILNLTLYDLVTVDREIIDSIIRKIQQEKLDLVQESIHRGKNGILISVELSISVIQYSSTEIICCAVRDITDRKKSEEILRYHVGHDLLTKLANRNLFHEQLEKTIVKAQRYNYQFAIIFIDLDRFKNINDTLGHHIGDQFLRLVAERLQKCLRNADLIARWGGDEFTILLSEIRDSTDVTMVAQRILNNLKKPFSILHHQLYASLSMGIAIYPQDGKTANNLLKNADIALYRMKEQGRGCYRYYSPIMNQKKAELLRMEGYLYDAIKNKEFELYYQPQINIISQKIIGMEALIRWNNPYLGKISPAKFIPIAEETGLINPIDEWVLFTACQQNKIWQEMGFSDMTIAVNLSARQFQQKNLVQIVKNTLKKTNLAPEYLDLEVTETSIISNPETAKHTIKEINKLGVSISLDDFGTGYSSLNYLKKFSFDKIKIDQSFVRELTNNSKDLAIVSAVITLGKGFNLKVIAEGIENLQQLTLLKELQCEEMQGYFFSHPLPQDKATEFIISANQNGISFL